MALWTPAEVVTDYWFDASDSSTITIDTGVSNWSDKSGNNNDASQTSASNQPVSGTNQLEFDGNDYLEATTNSLGTSITAFIISSTDSEQTQRILDSKGGSASTAENGGFQFLVSATASTGVSFTVSNGTTANRLNTGSDTIYRGQSQNVLIGLIANDSDNAQEIWYNGGAIATTTSSGLIASTTITEMYIGTGYTSISNGLSGTISEMIIISDELSTAERQIFEGYLAWKWNLEGDLPVDHPYKNAAPTIVVSSSALASSGGPIPTIPTVRTLVDLVYDLRESFRTLVDLVYGLKLAKIIELPYGDLTLLKKIINFEYGDLIPLRKLINLPYGDLSQIRTLIDLPYNIQEQIRKLVDLRYHIIEEEMRTLIDLNYNLQSRDHLRKVIEIIYAIASGVSLEQTSSISVENTLSDTQPNLGAINPFHINVEKDESDPCIRAEIRSNVQSDYELNPEGSEIRVTINSDVYIVLVEEREITSAISQDGTEVVDTFTLKMSSPCMLLDSPYADLISEELSGMASEIASYVVAKEADFTYGLEWNIIDWYIPPGVFSVSDATPIAILEELASAGGGIRQSKKDGTLEIRYEYPVNIPDYETNTPEVYLTDQENFYGVNSVTERYRDENNFLIGNEETDTSSLDISYEDISSYSKEARVFQVPWNDDTIRLNTSALTGVTIQENGVTSLLVEDEEVEIIDGGGSLSLPIYNLVSSSYSDTNLGTITFDEDGTITTSTKENSIVFITYYTKFHKFTVSNDDIENVQFWPEII